MNYSHLYALRLEGYLRDTANCKGKVAEWWALYLYQHIQIKYLVLCITMITFCCSVTHSCLTLCNPMDCSMPDLPVPRHLPKFAQVPVCYISDAINDLILWCPHDYIYCQINIPKSSCNIKILCFKMLMSFLVVYLVLEKCFG